MIFMSRLGQLCYTSHLTQAFSCRYLVPNWGIRRSSHADRYRKALYCQRETRPRGTLYPSVSPRARATLLVTQGGLAFGGADLVLSLHSIKLRSSFNFSMPFSLRTLLRMCMPVTLE